MGAETWKSQAEDSSDIMEESYLKEELRRLEGPPLEYSGGHSLAQDLPEARKRTIQMEGKENNQACRVSLPPGDKMSIHQAVVEDAGGHCLVVGDNWPLGWLLFIGILTRFRTT